MYGAGMELGSPTCKTCVLTGGRSLAIHDVQFPLCTPPSGASTDLAVVSWLCLSQTTFSWKEAAHHPVSTCRSSLPRPHTGQLSGQTCVESMFSSLRTRQTAVWSWGAVLSSHSTWGGQCFGVGPPQLWKRHAVLRGWSTACTVLPLHIADRSVIPAPSNPGRPDP